MQFDAACIHSLDEALEAAERIGYPVMLKASEGGGGKGIRRADDVEALKTLRSKLPSTTVVRRGSSNRSPSFLPGWALPTPTADESLSGRRFSERRQSSILSSPRSSPSKRRGEGETEALV